MNKLLKIVLGVFVLLVVAVGGVMFYHASQREALYEAVVRDIGENTQSNANAVGAKILFVRVEGQDPSPEFLARFQGAPYSVRPGSRARPGQRSLSDLTSDTQTGEPGLEVRITRTTWLPLSSPMVFANGFVMSDEDGNWRVQYVTIFGMG